MNPMESRRSSGYTLVELIVAVGLFAIVMALSSGTYLMMIGLNRQAQGIAIGIDDLSFALETMTRDIRTGSAYDCGGAGDCPGGASSFSFLNKNNAAVTYSLSGTSLVKTMGSIQSTLTDPSVAVSSLTFYAYGTRPAPGDYQQSRVVIIMSGTVSTGAGKAESFTVETAATMRGTDI